MESITATSRGRAGEKRLIGTGIRTARPMPALLAVLLLMVGPGLPVTQAQPGRAHVGMGGSLPANPANPEQLEGYFRGYCSQRDDAYPDLVGRDFGILNGAEHLTPQRWAERMGPVIERINQLAPTARIMFVSYPEIGDGNGGLCLANLGGGSAQLPVPVPVPTNVERFFDTVNSTAAAHQHLGYECVHTDRPGTGTCAPAGSQWVRSIFDVPGAGDGLHMPFHPSALGDRSVADIVMSRI